MHEFIYGLDNLPSNC